MKLMAPSGCSAGTVVGDLRDLWFGELNFGTGGEASEVVLHVLEDEVEAAGHAGGDKAVEFDDVRVVEASEDEDLAGHEADALGLEVVEAHLLERHDLAAHRVARLVHVAVRALADLPGGAAQRDANKAFVSSQWRHHEPREGERDNGRARGRTLSIFSKESARRGVHPSMASPATAESQAGQPAATCSPRALLAKLGAGALRDERERLSRQAGFSAGAAGCSAFPAASCVAAGAGGSGSCGGWSGLDAGGRPCTQPMGCCWSPAAAHGAGGGDGDWPTGEGKWSGAGARECGPERGPTRVRDPEERWLCPFSGLRRV
jgi:hypothetical protein